MKKIWKDPVWSSVIAGLILTVVLGVGSHFLGFWPYIAKGAIWVWQLITADIPVPLWLLVLGIPALVSCVPLISRFAPDSEPKFTKYTHDHILGIDWSWRWAPPNRYRTEYKFEDLIARCPGCKSVLNIDDYDHRLVYCINDSCDWSWPLSSERYPGFHMAHRANTIDHSSKLNERVVKEIDRRVHTGDWESG